MTHGSCFGHNLMGKLLCNTVLWHTEERALILLWTEKVCFELGLERISLETRERAGLYRTNKVYTHKEVGEKNHGVFRKDSSISLVSRGVCMYF